MKIFVAGAAGYIGGTVADALLRAGHAVTGLVRSPERAAALRERGIVPVVGTLADLAVLATAARAADAVVHAANADDKASVVGLLDALRGSGKAFVHTSGAGIVADGADGEPTDRVHDEATPVAPLPERRPRVALNEAIRAAAGEGVRTVVIAPPMIYGRGRGLKTDSAQVPKLFAVARARGAACCIGRGLNVWSNVHVDDLAALYLRVLEAAPPGAFYYAENGEQSIRETAAAIGRRLGVGDRVEGLAPADAASLFGEAAVRLSFGSNCRERAARARSELGWSPSHASLNDEIARH
ncbi:MAG TPA: NAD-dependent epimerase/dehydratase family protein [Casimicrobiaceae bacterium]|nr:NAD-dependent epimerase/dehydratase family protein [Casimicrobiaceae bacterium]